MSYRHNGSISAGEGALIGLGFFVIGAGVAFVVKACRHLSSSSCTQSVVTCACCSSECSSDAAEYLDALEFKGRVFEGGVACSGACYESLRTQMADEVFKCGLIKFESINYHGARRVSIRFNREICTPDFHSPNAARRELSLQAVELGCDAISSVEVLSEEVVQPNGRVKTWFWATGKV